MAIFLLQHKLDGASIALYYESGKLKRAVGRGDGWRGEDITKNILYMKNVRLNISDFNGSLRGEIILPKSAFVEFFKPLGFANPRNAAVGKSREKTPDKNMLRHIKIIYFDVAGPVFKEEQEKLNLLDSWKLERVNSQPCDNPDEIWTKYKDIESLRSFLDLEIDGVIIRANSLAVQERLGSSSDLRPKGQRCLKFAAQVAETKLLGLDLTIGHTGNIVPTGRVEPVEIGGVTVSNVLLNNFAYCAKLGLAIGDILLVERAGDVVPHVVRVAQRADDRVPIVPPSVCIACGGPLTVDGAALSCTNDECEGRAIRRLKTWITKRDIKYIGDELLVELFERQGVKEPQDLYRLTEQKLAKMPRGKGVVGSMSKQIMAEIIKSKKCPLAEFVGSLATKFMGRRQAEIMIEGGIDTLEKFVTLTNPGQLADIPGFSLEGSKATELIKGLVKARPTMKALLDVGVEVIDPGQEEQPVASEGATLGGMAVCFTGVRPKSDEELRFRALGGVIKDGVSKNCTHLVVRDPSTTSNKAQKARDLGVKIIGYEEFQGLLG